MTHEQASSSDRGSTNACGGRSSTSGDHPECSDATANTESHAVTTRSPTEPMPTLTRSVETLARIFEFVDFKLLPPQTRPIARMLIDGFTQIQIAAELHRSPDWVAARVRELRDEILRQALAKLEEMDTELRAYVELLRSTVSAGGGRTGKRRTE